MEYKLFRPRYVSQQSKLDLPVQSQISHEQLPTAGKHGTLGFCIPRWEISDSAYDRGEVRDDHRSDAGVSGVSDGTESM